MPESDYRALNAVQTYIKDGVASGLHVWQSHSLASPTERGDPSPRGSVVIRGKSPSPTGNLLPAPPPQPISQGLPMPKAVSEGASAGQGGVVPSRGSGPVPISGKGSGQRREVPAGEEVRGQREVNQDATSERDVELEELRQQIRALQQASVQNVSVTQPVVQDLPAQQQSGQGKGQGQVRQGVIPNRDQSGLQSKTAGLGGNASMFRSKSPPGLSVGGQGSSAARVSELVGDGVPRQSRSPPGYSDADESIWDQAYLSKALQQMKDSEISKLRFTPTSYKPLEYEKWIKTVTTTMKGLHPEIGRYWQAVCTLA